jgi:hypothetical protein
MFPDRFNVLGTLPGRGDGYSLIFGSEPVGGTPEQTAQFLESELPRWEAAINAAKIPKQ